MTILESEPPGVDLATCFAFVAVGRIVSGSFTEAIDWCDRSLELATKLEVGWLESRALSYRGVARCFLGDAGGLHDLRRALGVAESHGSSREHALALLVRAEVEWATEGPVVALETVREGGDLAERRGLLDMGLWFDALSLGPLFDVGAWDELLQVADDVLRRSREAGGDYAAGLAQPWLAQVLLWRGRRDEAADAASESMVRSAHIRDAQVLVPAEVAAALVAVREGRGQDAIRIVEELERESEVSLAWYRENFLADLVRVCAATGGVPLARRLIDGARVTAQRHDLSLLSARATLEETLGNLEAAADLYEQAVEGWTRYGHQLETGIALLGASRCRSGLGAPEPGDHDRRAEEIFAALGAAPPLDGTAGGTGP